MRNNLVIFLCVFGITIAGISIAQEPGASEREQSIQARIRENDLDAALKSLEESTQAKIPVSIAVRQDLTMALLRANRTDEAAKQATEILNETYRTLVEEGNAGPFTNAFMRSSIALIRNNEKAAAEEWLNKAIATLEPKLSSTDLNQAHVHFSDLLKERLRFLDDKGPAAEGLERLRQHIAKSEKLFELAKPDDTSTANMILLWNGGIPTMDAELAQEYFNKSHALASATLKNNPTLPVLQAYASSVTGFVANHGRSDPEVAGAALASANALLEELEGSDAAIATTLGNLRKSVQRLEKTVEDSRALLAMIGQQAPEWEPWEWAHGEPQTQESLKGKVVLLDFWAVWCGPCIATFPHLKHLSESYGPRGLSVVGVTRQYNYAWDEDTQSAKRLEVDVSIEDELTMLEKFMASHELTHPTMVTAKESQMQPNYKVTGIPHAVLIDKLGKVRLVKIGSGEKNAADIEATIQKLLDE